MKDVSELVAVVCDFGTFTSLADRLGETYSKVYYHSPMEDEYLELSRCCKGVGIDNVVRLDDFMEPDIVKEADLYIFPDIGFGGHQRYLKSIGKPVWGSMGASDLEVYRTRFIETLKKVGLPMVESEKIVGLGSLSDYLKEVKNKWVKVNRYRGDRETFKHIDYTHTVPILNDLAVKWGPLADTVVFVVQDEIETDIEIGYDGWLIDGQFPTESFYGYEKKNQLYLGSLLKYEDLPEGVRVVNEAFAPALNQYGFRNFMSTEIREKDGTPYFIDPTARMAGQTMEHQLRSCENLPEVIWNGSNGVLVTPVFNAMFSAEATMHYSPDSEWKTILVPEEAKPWTMLYHYCIHDGAYHFPPSNGNKKTDEVGVVIGNGDSIEEAIEALKEHFELFKDEPLSIEFSGFKDLLESIHSAEDEGIEFTPDEVPDPSSVLSL